MGVEEPAMTRLGFIGAGQMSEALARGLVKAGILPADRIFASKGSRKAIFEGFGVTVCSNSEVVEQSNVVIIAVKPQILKTVLTELRPHLTKDHLLVSIAAGITIDSLQSWGGEVRVVKSDTKHTLPSCLSAGSSANQRDVDLVKTVFDAIGKTVVVEENFLNAVTGVSESGPAFVYIAIEAMADGGVAAGLPRATALSLATQTFIGAGKIVLETKQHPGQLKDEVASPAGTTIAGLYELEKAGFRAAWMNAVLATAKRGATGRRVKVKLEFWSFIDPSTQPQDIWAIKHVYMPNEEQAIVYADSGLELPEDVTSHFEYQVGKPGQIWESRLTVPTLRLEFRCHHCGNRF